MVGPNRVFAAVARLQKFKLDAGVFLFVLGFEKVCVFVELCGFRLVGPELWTFACIATAFALFFDFLERVAFFLQQER